MRVGGSIALGVIGAILFFAVTVDVAGISLSTVGIILMIAAAVWFVVELARGFSDAGDQRGTASSGQGSGSSAVSSDRTADQRA